GASRQVVQTKHHEAAPGHDAKCEEWNRDRRALIRWKVLQTLDLSVDLVSQDKAPHKRHVDRAMIRFGHLVGDGEERDRNAATGFPMRLDRRKLGRLVLQGAEP